MPTPSQPRLPRVTESLRRQWASERAQMVEERTHDQSGRRRPAEGVWEQDFTVKVMDALLALPVGARFDSRAVQDEVRATMTHPSAAAARAARLSTPLPGIIRGQGSETIAYDAEVQVAEGEPWTVKASEFADETEAWGYIGDMRAKPVWAPCFWRVTEVRRKTSGMVLGPVPQDAAEEV